MDNYNILFSSAGRRVSLIQHFRKTLAAMGIAGKIITADMQKNAPASFIGDVREFVPPVTAPDYINEIMDICRKHSIKLLIPLIDTELNILAAYKKDLEALGVMVLVSSPEVNNICFDKRNTHQFFKRIGAATPEIYDPEELLADSATNYPLFLKPANGSSSKGAMLIKNAWELKFFKDYIHDAIVQEYVTGKEYTLDILVDLQGKVRSIVPRLRIETRAGEVSKAITVKDAAVISAGQHVAEALPGAVGCITVQCFKTVDDDVKFIEINPRFGGGFPLSIKAGADFPRWIIEMMFGINSKIGIDEWREGVVMLRYDGEVFVTKDDIK